MPRKSSVPRSSVPRSSALKLLTAPPVVKSDDLNIQVQIRMSSVVHEKIRRLAYIHKRSVGSTIRLLIDGGLEAVGRAGA